MVWVESVSRVWGARVVVVVVVVVVAVIAIVAVISVGGAGGSMVVVTALPSVPPPGAGSSCGYGGAMSVIGGAGSFVHAATHTVSALAVVGVARSMGMIV